MQDTVATPEFVDMSGRVDFGGRGTDGNSNSGSSDNALSVDLASRPGLSSDWSYKAQFSALKSGNPADEFSFKESSVKDVTDRGRTQAAGHLKLALEESLKKGASSKKRKSPAVGGDNPELPCKDSSQVESEIRGEVKEICRHLKRLREVGGSGASACANATDLIMQLECLPVSVSCLKSTKVAVELNLPYWKSSEAPAAVRGQAKALVRRWRTMYRAEEGVMDTSSNLRQCQSLSMELEDCAYGRNQKVGAYAELIEWTRRLLLEETETVSNLVLGCIKAHEVLARVAQKLKMEAVAARSQGRFGNESATSSAAVLH